MTSIVSNRPAEIRGPVLLGANGRLGRMIRSFWGDADLQAVARRSEGGVIRGDLLAGGAQMQAILQGRGAVVCMAGVTPGPAEADLSLNVDLALVAVRAAHAAGAGRVFLASSAAVYGRQSGVLNEATPCAPLSAYGRAKAEMEEAALALGAQLRQPVTVLRIGNVAGADAILGGWHPAMAIDQLPDGTTPVRSYIGPQSLSVVIAALTRLRDLPAVINVAAPGGVEMGALLNAAGLAWSPRPAPSEVIANVTLCTKGLARYVTLPEAAATAAGLVAEWQSWRERGE